jgi:hypothetical protein
VTLAESLRKNASFLLLGFGSAIVALVVMRQSSGEPLFQPQSDFGVVIGAVLVTAFVVFKDMRATNGKLNS